MVNSDSFDPFTEDLIDHSINFRGGIGHLRVRCYDPEKYICPYCDKTYPINVGHVILKKGSVVERKLQKRETRHWIIKELHKTYETFYLRQCPDCYKKRKTQKNIIILIGVLFCLIAQFAFIIYSLANQYNLSLISVFTFYKDPNLWQDSLIVLVFAAILAYFICSYFINKCLGKYISKEDAYSNNALPTEKEIRGKFHGEKDNYGNW